MDYRLIRWISLGLGALLLAAGCSPVVDEPFAVAQEVRELPELHQANLQEGLRRMFGTMSRPKVVMLAEEGEDAEQEEIAGNSGSSKPEELMDSAQLRHGAAVYRNRCAGCHGASGDGQGPAAIYLRPRPRDYRKAVYKFTSTPYGARPARQDLVRTIRRGAKGTSMPAFAWLSEEDLQAVVDYVMYLSFRGRVEEQVVTIAEDYDEDEDIEVVEFTDALQSEWNRWQKADSQIVRSVSAEPAYDELSVELGRRLFIKSSCYQCHGADAKGQTRWLSPEFIAAQESAADGSREQINYDAWGNPAPAADITARMLHGGRRSIDIYRRIYTGINGTPMPAFGQVFSEDPDAVWHMVHYVMHIVDGGDPTVGLDVEDVIQPAADQNAEASG